MNEFDEFDTLVESMEFEDFEERFRRPVRPPVRTPSRRTSFTPKPTSSAASQTQVLSTARNLDNKIETLTNGVKALEARTSSVEGAQTRLTAELRKEAAERKKAVDATRGDLQQTKMLSLLLPMLTQRTVDAIDENDRPIKVVAASENQLATMLPLLLLLQPGTLGSGDAGTKGSFGDGLMPILLVLLLSDRK